jgi:hypothetical protein
MRDSRITAGDNGISQYLLGSRLCAMYKRLSFDIAWMHSFEE